MIVAGQHQCRVMFRRPREVRVPEHIAATVHSGAFAIPDAKHAVELRAAEYFKHLAAHYRCSRNLFIHARNEMNVERLQQLLRPQQSHVVTSQR